MRTVTRVRAHLAALPDGLVELHIYCKGGKHRSVAVAEEAALWLRAAGIGTEVRHRDITEPLVQS